MLLKSLSVACIPLYCEPNGEFPHNPEPLPKNLKDLSETVVKESADLGIAVDPDVDRLALVCKNGSMFGEEYTLVACADYVLQHTPSNTVSNMSSSRALKDLTIKYGQKHKASAVGEINVVEMMKQENAIIGGEGSGGIIYAPLHHGRDALVGVALFLSHLAKKQMACSALRASYPSYFMSKEKISLTEEIDTERLLSKIKEKYSHEQITTIDGVKIDFSSEWVHLRKSNTEPIIRVYTESTSQEKADSLAARFVKELEDEA
jgi:phosphomannomutase